MPTVPDSSVFAFAFVVLTTTDAAESVRSFNSGCGPGGPRPALEWISAFVLTSAISSASEPAIATLPPPAPAVESVTKVCLPSAPPAFRIAAASSRPLDETSASVPTVASFVTFTRLIATAAPMFAVGAWWRCRPPWRTSRCRPTS